MPIDSAIPIAAEPQPAGLGGRLAWLRAMLAAERDRWSLWLPVGFGSGIAAYFLLPSEPSWWLGAAVLVVTLGLAAGARRRADLMPWIVALGAVAAGFSAAQWRTASVAAPILQREIGPILVTGQVLAVEQRPAGRRILLGQPTISRLSAEETPARVRVVLNGRDTSPAPGDWLRVRAVLRPPPEPAAPGAFDFARRAYFQRIGAVGFAYGSAEVLPPPEGQEGSAAGAMSGTLWLARVRQQVSERVAAALPGETGAVAVALITGERGAIRAEILQAMRDSGLAHLLAISGLHIGLVAGTIFFLLRAALALLPAVALRYPIKKWSACAAMVGAFVYLLLSGATVPTQRAFLMVVIVLLGVLLDRSAVTMRLVAWAAFTVLLLAPESLLSASFQMSFAAVTALVAGYEALRDRRRLRLQQERSFGLAARLFLYFSGVALSSVIAILATAPFALHHFNRLALYGLAANLVAVPLTALWIMPLALVSLLLMPLGQEAIGLVPMGWGLELVLAVARSVAAWPGAVTLLPAMPAWGLPAAVAGGLWLCLWKGRWRWVGVAGVALGLLSLAAAHPPDLLVSDDGRLMAVRGPDGRLAVSSRRRARFTAEQWLRRSAQSAADVWPRAGEPGRAWLACDDLGCIYRPDGWSVALVRDPRALEEDCRMAQILIASVSVPRACARDGAGPRIVVSRYHLWRDGGHALWLDGEAPRIETVRAARGARPWTRLRDTR